MMNYNDQEVLDAKIQAKRLVQMVKAHNRECEEECELNCDRGSGCPACPKNFMVDLTPISIMENTSIDTELSDYIEQTKPKYGLPEDEDEDTKQHLAADVSPYHNYYPDSWVIIRVKETGLYKVLGGWSGGYLQGDSWRMNSGIVRVEEGEGYWLMHGHSGSIYRCDEKSYGLRMSTTGIYMKIKDKVDVMPRVTNWSDLL